MFLAISVFLLTLTLVIIQPRGLQIGVSAMLGALVVYFLGLVDFLDVLEVISLVWDATLSLIGIIILSMAFEEIGFFEWCAIKMAKLSNGSVKKMFIYTLLLGTLVSAFFGNDGAALILTPILLTKMRILKLDTKSILAFLLAGGFIADSSSFYFIFSNLTNIIVANYFFIGFSKYLFDLLLTSIISSLVSIVFLYYILHNDLSREFDTALLKDKVIKDKALFMFSWFFLAILLCGYFVGERFDLPISFFALGGGVLFLAIASLRGEAKFFVTIKLAPWQIVWFSIGLYIVVFALKNSGLSDVLRLMVGWFISVGDTFAIFGVGILSALLSAFMNNLPTVMIMNIAIEPYQKDLLAYANLIGCNIGPKLTPFGSLATLLWLFVLNKKGIYIDYKTYMKFGFRVTPIVLAVTLASLIF